jgi:hypothetical protein
LPQLDQLDGYWRIRQPLNLLWESLLQWGKLANEGIA